MPDVSRISVMSWPAQAGRPVIAAEQMNDGQVGDYWVIRLRG
jgi:hypothetical protein